MLTDDSDARLSWLVVRSEKLPGVSVLKEKLPSVLSVKV